MFMLCSCGLCLRFLELRRIIVGFGGGGAAFGTTNPSSMTCITKDFKGITAMLDIWIIFMEPTLRLWTGSKATGKQKKEKLRQENENEK